MDDTTSNATSKSFFLKKKKRGFNLNTILVRNCDVFDNVVINPFGGAYPSYVFFRWNYLLSIIPSVCVVACILPPITSCCTMYRCNATLRSLHRRQTRSSIAVHSLITVNERTNVSSSGMFAETSWAEDVSSAKLRNVCLCQNYVIKYDSRVITSVLAKSLIFALSHTTCSLRMQVPMNCWT